MKSIDIDLLVIGAGPSGLAAAIEAEKAGVKNIVVVERAEELGGLLHQCIHTGFGLQYFKEDLTGPEYAYMFIDKLRGTSINIELETMVLDITKEQEVIAVNSRNKIMVFKPKALILSMGCRERARGALNIPGSRPSGIFTAGTAQRLINVSGYIPGKEVVILGSGDIGMIMARRLTLEGAKIKKMAELLPFCGGLLRNEIQCLRDFDISLELSHTVTNIYGNYRLQGVEISEVDDSGVSIEGTEEKIDCDTLLLSVGLIPENELSKKAGIELNKTTNGPLVNEYYQTNIPWIFCGGNVLHVHDLVDNVSYESELCARSAATYIQNGIKDYHARITMEPGRNIRYIVPNKISGKEDVKFYMRVAKPENKVQIKVGDILVKKYEYVRPSEMIAIKVSKRKLEKVDSKEIMISCEEGEK